MIGIQLKSTRFTGRVVYASPVLCIRKRDTGSDHILAESHVPQRSWGKPRDSTPCRGDGTLIISVI